MKADRADKNMREFMNNNEGFIVHRKSEIPVSAPSLVVPINKMFDI